MISLQEGESCTLEQVLKAGGGKDVVLTTGNLILPRNIRSTHTFEQPVRFDEQTQALIDSNVEARLKANEERYERALQEWKDSGSEGVAPEPPLFFDGDLARLEPSNARLYLNGKGEECLDLTFGRTKYFANSATDSFGPDKYDSKAWATGNCGLVTVYGEDGKQYGLYERRGFVVDQFEGMSNTPGGMQKPWEDPTGSWVREVAEEVGVPVDILEVEGMRGVTVPHFSHPDLIYRGQLVDQDTRRELKWEELFDEDETGRLTSKDGNQDRESIIYRVEWTPQAVNRLVNENQWAGATENGKAAGAINIIEEARADFGQDWEVLQR